LVAVAAAVVGDGDGERGVSPGWITDGNPGLTDFAIIRCDSSVTLADALAVWMTLLPHERRRLDPA